jgi:hypothetical protein
MFEINMKINFKMYDFTPLNIFYSYINILTIDKKHLSQHMNNYLDMCGHTSIHM